MVDGFWCVELLQSALVEHCDAVGHGKRFVVIMRHEDRRGLRPAEQVVEFLAHAPGHVGIEVAERFIEQEQHGMLDQRSSEGHALLLASGQFMGIPSLEAFQTDEA